MTAVHEKEKCIDAIKLMKENGFDQLPVTDGESNLLYGMITVSDVMAKIAGGMATLESPVCKVLMHQYPCVMIRDQLEKLIKLLQVNPYVAIVDELNGGGGQIRIAAIVTHIDILDFLSRMTSA